MRRLNLCLLTLPLVLGTGGLLAAEGERGPGPFEPRVLFQRLDKNQDGKITADEIPEGAPERIKEFLKRADKNQDKVVTAEEFREAVQQFHPGMRGPFRAPPQAAEPGSAGPQPQPGTPGMGPPPWAGRRGFGGGPPWAGRPGMGPPPWAGRPGAGGPPPQVPDAKALFAELDRDHDGKLSPEEFAEGMKRFHRRPMGPPGPAARMAPGAPWAGPPWAKFPAARPPWAGMPWGPPPAARAAMARAMWARAHGMPGPAWGPWAMMPPPGAPKTPPKPSAVKDAVTARLKAADKNKDGKLSREEAPEFLKKRFDKLDTNKDGQLDPAELKQFAETHRQEIQAKFAAHREEVGKRIEAAHKRYAEMKKGAEVKKKGAEVKKKGEKKRDENKPIVKKGEKKDQDNKPVLKKGDAKNPTEKKPEEKKPDKKQ
jgi:Ca2+-binding EF-hand superfamily protein